MAGSAARRAGAAAAALLLSAGLATGCGDEGGLRAQARQAARERSDQAGQAARDAGLGPEVAAFLAAAAGVVGETFTVTYASGDGSTTTVVQEPPLRRVDVRGGAVPAGGVRTAMVTREGSFACQRQPGGGDPAAGWSCQPSDAGAPAIGPYAGGDLERAVFDLADARRTYDLVVDIRRMLDLDVRCLVTTRRADAPPDPSRGLRATLCTTADGGIPVLVEGATTLTATALRRTADARDLELPARPA